MSETTPQEPKRPELFRAIGAGIITGAADDDPSAIGTYASAGAKFGLGLLWIAPVVLPMMFVVTYLSAKLGRVYGKGLFATIRDRYPAYILYPIMAGAFVGNIIEAAADLGGIGSALNLLVPVPIPIIVVGTAIAIVLLQFFGSYVVLRRVFKWLTLALFAYIGAGILARPQLGQILRGTFIPHIQFNEAYLSILVACIGTSLSAYVYTWQSNQEVEEQIDEGRRTHRQRMGASEAELSRTRRDVFIGMLFSDIILYFIILSTGATLHQAGHTNINTAADAAAALQPLAGPAAKYLFALGVVGVGFLAVPVMTIGGAYDLAQGLGKPATLHAKPRQAKLFYATVVAVTALAAALNFLGFNPMKALVWSGIVQGFSVPPLLFMIMLMTNDRRLMGERKNTLLVNLAGWATTGIAALATLCLVVTWVI